MSLNELLPHKRPREKLIELGVKNLTDRELLAIILRTGTSKSNVFRTASHILKKSSIKEIAEMSVEHLQYMSGLGIAHASSIVAAIELGNRVRDTQNTSLTEPEQIAQLLHDIALKKQEHFVCMYLNARHHLISKKTISIGTIDASLAHPREIFRPGIEVGASFVIIAHNHPSGDPEPSDADVLLTARVAEVGEIIGIQLMDHIIISRNGWVSLKGKEMM